MLSALRGVPPGGSVLVHGPAGSGKSEVLAGVLKRLREDGVPVLPLLPDMTRDEIGLGDDPAVALHRYAARGLAVVLVDQLDQAVSGSDGASVMMRRCGDLLRGARACGMRILGGCRTVDARHDTQLRHLLAGGQEDHLAAIPIGDLDATTVRSALAEEGIRPGELEPATLKIAERPVCLRMMIEAHRRGADVGALRNLVAVVDTWWAAITANLPGCDAKRAADALDGVIARIERTGGFSAAEDGLADPGAIAALVAAGVLAREVRGGLPHLRPFHQVLADVRVASSWRDAANAGELLEGIGPRDRQGLHQARRLRLAVPLLLERADGVHILEAVAASGRLRPLVERGLWLGLAAVDSPGSDLVGLVISWSEKPRLQNPVLSCVVRGQRAWMEALGRHGWLDRAWARADAAGRDRLMGLMGAVATSWQDGIARTLRRWMGDDPDVLDRRLVVFLGDPADDSDDLFAMRLQRLRRSAEHYHSVDWSGLLARRPERAAAMLAVLLPQTSVEDLYGWRTKATWPADLPPARELPDAMDVLGHRGWECLREWWLGLPDLELLRVHAERKTLGESILVVVVEILARSLAGHLAAGPRRFDELLGGLPAPLRELDGWLVLRVGAKLPGDARPVADAMIEWFTGDPRWARLRLGTTRGRDERGLARSFVGRIAAVCSDGACRHLERWIARYRDPWSATDERERWQRQRSHPESGLPSDVGMTARYLLSAIPRDRRSLPAERLLNVLERKFIVPMAPRLATRGGHIVSVIPDEVADRWSAREWTRRLCDPGLHTRGDPERWHQLDESTAGEYSLELLCQQLRGLAARRPTRYLEHAREFDLGVPASAREALLSGVATTSPPHGTTTGSEWRPAAGEMLAEILVRPCYLTEPECARQVAWLVAERPSYRWPDAVIDRLAEMTAALTDCALVGDVYDNLESRRINETGCVALMALGWHGEEHPDRAGVALSMARRALDDRDPARRAAAALAALRCVAADQGSALEVVLAAAEDERVATDHEVLRGLVHLATSDDVPSAVRDRARARVLQLASSAAEEVASRGGRAMMALRYRGALDDTAMEQVFTGALPVREGAERGVTDLIQGLPEPPAWVWEAALRLADDVDDEIGRSILQTIELKATSKAVGDSEFLARLLRTRAARRDVEPVVSLCDRHDQLTHVADAILEVAATTASSSSPGVDRWRHARHVSDVVGLVGRLVEEAQLTLNHDLRRRALDAWDTLLEAGIEPAMFAVDSRVKEHPPGNSQA